MLTLTVAEIRDLARFAGLSIDETFGPSDDELETLITVGLCPAEGMRNDGEPSDPESVSHYKHMAYYTDYPDEGGIGLGDEIAA